MKCLIVDGNNLLARASHIYREAEDRSGFPIGGLYGSVAILKKYLAAFAHDSVVVAIDRGVPAFRKEVCPEYKAQRATKRTPQEQVDYERYKQQVPVFHEVLVPLGITTARAKDFEGDDIIAALVHEKLPDDTEITILSSDRDFIQLVTEDGRVRLWDPMRDEYRAPDPHFCLKRCMDPKQSDNLDGVPGIGKVKADKLVQAWETEFPEWSPFHREYLNSFLDWCALAGQEMTPLGKMAAKVVYDQQKVRANWRCTFLHNTTEDCSKAMKFRRGEQNKTAFKDVCRRYRLRPLLEDLTGIWPTFRDLQHLV